MEWGEEHRCFVRDEGLVLALNSKYKGAGKKNGGLAVERDVLCTGIPVSVGQDLTLLYG